MRTGEAEALYSELACIIASSSEPRFRQLSGAPERHGTPFEFHEGFNVALGSGSGGTLELDAQEPFMDAPFYRLRAVGCDARSWYRIEFRLSPELLTKVSAIVPIVEASSPEGVTIFASLRLDQSKGRSSDVGSAQIDVGRARQVHSLPISFQELPAADLKGTKDIALCLLIQARPAALHIYRLSLLGIGQVDLAPSNDELEKLRTLAASNSPRVQRRAILGEENGVWTGTAEGHQRIAPNVFLDFEPALGRRVTVSRSGTVVDMVFERMREAQWRNLEFRFGDVRESGSLVMVIRTTGPSSADEHVQPRLILRQYNEAGSWADTPVPGQFGLFDPVRDGQTKIDLSPLLDEAKDVHNFGLMMFFPQEIERLEFSEIEVFVIDRAVEEPPPASRLKLAKLLRKAKRVTKGQR